MCKTRIKKGLFMWGELFVKWEANFLTLFKKQSDKLFQPKVRNNIKT